MPAAKPNRKAAQRRLAEAVEALTALQFGLKQRNETAAYTLLALLDLPPVAPWSTAQAPLRGITPIIEFIAEAYGVRYAPNTRETIRDDAVRFFAESGLLLRNPDNPSRPTNSGKTVYQVEPSALALFRNFGTVTWSEALADYLASRVTIQSEIARHRSMARVPVTLPDGSHDTLSTGGQNPLIKSLIEHYLLGKTDDATPPMPDGPLNPKAFSNMLVFGCRKAFNRALAEAGDDLNKLAAIRQALDKLP